MDTVVTVPVLKYTVRLTNLPEEDIEKPEYLVLRFLQ